MGSCVTNYINRKTTYDMTHVENYGGKYDSKTFNDEVKVFDWKVDPTFKPLDVPLDIETQEFTYNLCTAYNIDWTLVMAIMQTESNFKSDTISKTNDYGLMQINKVNHQWLTEKLGITDYLDKTQNIRAGVFVLRKLFEEYTDPKLVLMAYNMGSNGAEALWNKKIYTTPYVDKVLENQRRLKND